MAVHKQPITYCTVYTDNVATTYCNCYIYVYNCIYYTFIRVKLRLIRGLHGVMATKQWLVH